MLNVCKVVSFALIKHIDHKKKVILRLSESESAVESCMMTSLLDLWICCYTVTALSPHESAMFCTVSQDLRISESAVDSCII